MGKERKIFSELVDQPISEVPFDIITTFLFEISSGVLSFRDAEDEVTQFLIQRDPFCQTYLRPVVHIDREKRWCWRSEAQNELSRFRSHL